MCISAIKLIDTKLFIDLDEELNIELDGGLHTLMFDILDNDLDDVLQTIINKLLK